MSQVVAVRSNSHAEGDGLQQAKPTNCIRTAQPADRMMKYLPDRSSGCDIHTELEPEVPFRTYLLPHSHCYSAAHISPIAAVTAVVPRRPSLLVPSEVPLQRNPL